MPLDGFSAAAQELRLAQPSISQRIRELEFALGTLRIGVIENSATSARLISVFEFVPEVRLAFS